MPTGIFPEDIAGGLIYRDSSGNPTNPPNVQNAYPPAPAFLSTCELTALPADCTARIEPRQINAIVSELVSLAECMDPDGTWDCNSLQNLCVAFTAYVNAILPAVYIGDTPPPNPTVNQLWWESDSGTLFLSYNDGNTIQWVATSGTPDKVVMDNISIVGAGTTEEPHRVGLIDCGSW